MDLTIARNILVVVVVVAASMLLGDYIGYKFGRMKLASFTLIITLVVVVAFAIYAAVTA
jgi:antibiotic biosynthesis monooxygenase (ABM) superfamily enzyme